MKRSHTLAWRSRGLSMIELMVGIAIGLFVIAGALTLFSDNVNNSRRLVLETRVNQDLRAAADLVARDLRRAGYWGNSTGAVVTTNASPTALTTPHGNVTPTAAAGAGTAVTYSYSQGTENNILDAGENFGFQLNSGVLEYRNGSSGWVPISDSNSVTITAFSVTPAHQCVSLVSYCSGNVSTGCAVCTIGNGLLDANGCPTSACTGAGITGCPRLTLRRFDIALQGTAASDSSVVRNLQESVRVRNEQFSGACT
jgi:prepilin peptidase dependent protein B